jgi:hypothetical protein
MGIQSVSEELSRSISSAKEAAPALHALMVRYERAASSVEELRICSEAIASLNVNDAAIWGMFLSDKADEIGSIRVVH